MAMMNIPPSMRLQNLQSEPKRLLTEADRLNEELDSLVMENYRVFIDNLTCSVFLRSEDKRIGECSQELGRDLNNFGQQCHHFRDRVGAYISAHKRNRKTLKHNMQLVELLEIPQLVDACSRNGFYDEALELAIFVNSLERKHVLASEVRLHSHLVTPSNTNTTVTSTASSGGNSVVQSIVDDVHVILIELRRQLLVQLSEEASLPKLLQLLGVLRKLDGILIDRQLDDEKHNNFNPLLHSEDSFDQLRKSLLQRVETTLHMNFLEARSVWMERSIREVVEGEIGHRQGAMRSSQAEDVTGGSIDPVLGPYGRGIELLEICRSSWYAIVTQFNALFAESVGEYSSRSLLSFWMENQFNILENELKSLLMNIDEGPSVRSLIEQCFSFSDRMSQVGCDFSSRILPVFEEVIITRIGKTWSRGLSSFKQMVETEKFMVEVEDGVIEQAIPLYLRQDQEDDSTDGNHTSSTNASSSSSSLMSYPPLAYLLNSILIGLNFLRDCPLVLLRDRAVAIFEEVALDLCKFLVLSSDDIKMKGKKYILDSSDKSGLMTPLSGQSAVSSEEHMDKVYALKIISDVIPHGLDCFRVIFCPSTLIAKAVKNATSDDFLQKSDVDFLDSIHHIEESCRKVLISGSLISVSLLPLKNIPNSSLGTNII